MQTAELDYIYKKDVFGKIKSDGGTAVVSPFNEPLYRRDIIRNESIWSDSILLNGSLTAAAAKFVECVDANNRTGFNTPSLYGYCWLTPSTSNWISKEFNSSYTFQLFYGSSGQTFSGVQNNVIDPLQYPYAFDYGSGTITFLTVPSYLTSGSQHVYAKGYVYTGGIGVSVSGSDLSQFYTQAQADWNVTNTTLPSYILNKPTITSPVNADWNSVTGLSQILNKPSLATVATSGSYTDLINKPSLDWTSVMNKPTSCFIKFCK